jgi:uncharacterized membrane protein YgcG
MRLFVTISVLIVCMNLNAQKEKFFASKWRENSPESTPPAASDYVVAKKDVFLYCLSNDDKNIYVDAKITESIEQNKVLQMGLTVWINTDGKSRKLIGVRYPIGAQYSRGQGRRGEGQGNSLVQPSPLAQANTIELVGFKDVETTRFPSNNPDNFRGFVKYDNDGNLLYSLTIPKSKLPAGGKNKDGSMMPMNLAIEYGAPPAMDSGRPSGYTPPPKIQGERRSGGGGGGGGRGGSMGGGAPGGGTPGGNSNAQNAPQPVTFWMKDIKLAEKK